MVPWACLSVTPFPVEHLLWLIPWRMPTPKSIVGGGDTALAVHRAGESESMAFISTGGGAALQLLEGKHMPGLAALPDRPY